MLLIACGTLALSILVVEAGTLPTRSPVEKLDERLEMLPAIFKMSENTVAMEDKHQCMEKLMCLLEKSLPESVNNSIVYLSKYLTNKDHDLDDETYAKVKLLLRSYPRLEHLVDAANHDGPEICSEAFPECTVPANVLMAVARAFDDDSIESSIVSEARSLEAE
ncbi:hypothetical protein DPMN_135000 [Dreissena polymorpha]|uniref:Uncharacterized protein n=1 Tax=Dreissena polymorpha TaxID=45954 RepID=A0A9D4JB77_DREPO|nr:hypothetical protein DPMN_135000 [Dreissena polymorpha]